MSCLKKPQSGTQDSVLYMHTALWKNNLFKQRPNMVAVDFSPTITILDFQWYHYEIICK